MLFWNDYKVITDVLWAILTQLAEAIDENVGERQSRYAVKSKPFTRKSFEAVNNG